MVRYRIAYAIALVCALVVFVMTNTPIALAALMLLVLMFVACAAINRIASGHTTVEFSVRPACQVGDSLQLDVTVRRPKHFPAGRIDGEVTSQNLMRGETTSIPLVLSAGRPGVAHYSLPLNAEACGRVKVSLGSLRLFDPLALTKHVVPCDFRAVYSVYPKLLDLSVAFERSPRATDAGVTYDPKRRGDDRSETFDIRDYQITDPTHAVHWKLSSKLDKLVVREASHPSNYDILVLVDLGCSFAARDHLDAVLSGAAPASDGGAAATGASKASGTTDVSASADAASTVRNADAADAASTEALRVPDDVIAAVLDLASSISFDLRRRGLCHNVALRDGDRLTDAMIDSATSFNLMLDVLIGTPMPATIGVDVDLFNWYRREHSFTKTVLVTATVNQTLFSELARNIDLSVVHVAKRGASALDENGSYSLVSIPVETLEDDVRSVVI